MQVTESNLFETHLKCGQIEEVGGIAQLVWNLGRIHQEEGKMLLLNFIVIDCYKLTAGVIVDTNVPPFLFSSFL